MENTNYEELSESKRQNLRKSMKKLTADASDRIIDTSRLKGLHKHFHSVKANIEKRSQELDFKEKELQNLSLDLDNKSKVFEAEKSKAGDLKKLVEECTEELRSKRNQLTARMDSSARIQRELDLRNKQLGQVKSELRSLCNEGHKVKERNREMKEESARKTKDFELLLDKIQESGKQLATVDEQLEWRQKQLQIRSLELVSTEKKLVSVRESIMLSNSDLKLKESMVQSLKNLITDCYREVNSKSEELGEHQKLIEHRIKEIDVLQHERDTIVQFIQVLSEELVAKEKTNKEILEIICRSSSEMEDGAKEIEAAKVEASDLNVRSEMIRHEVEGREKELALLKNQIELEKNKLLQFEREMEEETGRKKIDLELVLSKIEEYGKQLAAIDEQLESQPKLLEIQSMELGCVKESIKHYNSDLKLKEKLVQSLNNRVTVCNKTIDSRSEELREIEKQLEQKTSELQERSERLIAKEMELNGVEESIKCLKFDLKVKEKRDQALNNLITLSSEQLDLRCKELAEIQRELKLKKQLRQMSNMLVNRKKQPAAASTSDTNQQNAESEPTNDDGLKHYEFSASLTSNEVSDVLRALPNPAEFILEEVEEHISEELSVHDSLLEIMVTLFEELTKGQRSDNPQLQDKATQLATLWKGNINIEAPKSTLEALAFLMFIVAYGLKKLINEEETFLLASSIAHYEQAPRIFKSLSLNTEIRKFVKELIEKSQYIPAVRLICLFKLNKDEDFSPSHLITKEIISLRRSALENGPTESSQAKGKDAGKLRAILELVADYNLEINLPGFLISKLMIQRKSTPPLVRCSVKKGTSSHPQANSSIPASVQDSSVNLRVPKPEVKPFLN